MFTILEKYSAQRTLIKNNGNGHHDIGCVIYDKSSYRVLRDWLQ